jgi:hypothetical protein
MRSRERGRWVFRKRLEQIKLQRGHRDLPSLLIREPVCGDVEQIHS